MTHKGWHVVKRKLKFQGGQVCDFHFNAGQTSSERDLTLKRKESPGGRFILFRINPSGHMTFIQIALTSMQRVCVWRCVDINTTLYKHHDVAETLINATLYKRHDVSTLIRRCINVMCSMGSYSERKQIQLLHLKVYPFPLTHCRLNELSHTIYWKLLLLILGMSGYVA